VVPRHINRGPLESCREPIERVLSSSPGPVGSILVNIAEMRDGSLLGKFDLFDGIFVRSITFSIVFVLHVSILDPMSADNPLTSLLDLFNISSDSIEVCRGRANVRCNSCYTRGEVSEVTY
jgi:hypothetical protein